MANPITSAAVSIPEDLLRAVGSSRVVDKYAILTDSDVGISGEGSNIPIVQVPNCPPADHGGSFGFDATKPMTTIVKSANGQFVVGDMSKVPPEVMKKISFDIKAKFDQIGDDPNAAGASYSMILAKAFEDHFSCTMPDGSKLRQLNTWVSNGKDPFGRSVSLPPPAAAVPIRKEAKMNDYVSHQGAPGYPGQNGMYAPATHHTQHGVHSSYFGTSPNSPPPPSSFGPPPMPGQQVYRPQVPQPPVQHQTHVQHGAPPAPPSIPAPDKVVVFHLGSGTINSAFHYIDVQRQVMDDNGMPIEITYVILVRNRNAPGAGEGFVPDTPAPGYRLFITMPNSETFQVHQVMLRYSIKAVDHLILLVTPPPPIVQPTPAEDQQPMNPNAMLGEQAAPLTPEDAITNDFAA